MYPNEHLYPPDHPYKVELMCSPHRERWRASCSISSLGGGTCRRRHSRPPPFNRLPYAAGWRTQPPRCRPATLVSCHSYTPAPCTCLRAEANIERHNPNFPPFLFVGVFSAIVLNSERAQIFTEGMEYEQRSFRFSDGIEASIWLLSEFKGAQFDAKQQGVRIISHLHHTF